MGRLAMGFGAAPWRRAVPHMPRYLLADWDPEAGETMEAWAQRHAEEGWCAWYGSGCWFNSRGQRAWCVSLRHPEANGGPLTPSRTPLSPWRCASKSEAEVLRSSSLWGVEICGVR
jgi:hypothetical protein